MLNNKYTTINAIGTKEGFLLYHFFRRQYGLFDGKFIKSVYSRHIGHTAWKSPAFIMFCKSDHHAYMVL